MQSDKMIFILLAIVIIVLIIFIRHVRNRKTQPPGPLGLPFLGLLPFTIIQMVFSNYLPKVSQITFFRQMKEKYGDIWSIEMGGQRIVILASIDVVKEAFVDNGKIFAGRPHNKVFYEIGKNVGTVFSEGEVWRDNRQLAVHALRDLGMGKSDLEKMINTQANDMIKYLESNSSLTTNVSNLFLTSVSNIMSRLTFNNSESLDNPEFNTYIKNVKCAVQSNIIDAKMNAFPNLITSKLSRRLFVDVDNYLKAWKEVREFSTKKCKRRLQFSSSNFERRECVFDYFWSLRYKDKQNKDDDDKMFDTSYTMSDIYIAGSESTSRFLEFSCLILGRFQDVQHDLKCEIQALTDDFSDINMAMKKDCPKLNSFIDEVHRFCYIVPKMPHRAMETCTLRGYKIYPNDIVFGDLATISRDPSLFVSPDTFDAYRFMDDKKTKYIPNKNFIPFGIGKRACLGESIAIMEIFLFLSKILERFDISLPKETMDNFEGIVEGDIGFAHAPLDCKLIFTIYPGIK